MDKRCNNCFKMYSDSNNCPYCGYVIGTPPKERFHLYPGTELLGRYIIGQVVGFGGFGTTYKAWDKLCNNVVAIKEYFPIGAVNRNPNELKLIVYTEKERQFKKGLSSFIGEAASMVKFNTYDNIVNIYNYFEVNNTGYIVMELLEGQTLSSYLRNRKRKLSLEATIEIIRNVCEALSEVHKVGMIHRDISPENIFMCSDGRVKVIDFGAARETLDEEKKMTIILKPGYAPPEQYESINKQGPWTDIYAVGATLYLLLTGSKPQESTSRIQNDKLIAPSKVDPNIPSYLSNLVMKAMALDINKRYKTMEEFQQVLLSKAKEIINKNKYNNAEELNLNSVTSYRSNDNGYDLQSIARNKSTVKNNYKRNGGRKVVIVGVLLTIIMVVGLVVVLDKTEVLINKSKTSEVISGKNKYLKGKKSQISIWFTYDNKTEYDVVGKKKRFKKIEEKYEKKNPNIDIKIQFYDSDKYNEEISKRLENGKMPDIYESTNLKDEYLKDATKMSDIIPKSIKTETYGIKKLLSNKNYQHKLPLGFKLPMVFINAERDDYGDDYYSYYITSFEELVYYYKPTNILVDDSTYNMYKNFKRISECELTNIDGGDHVSSVNEFLKTYELFNDEEKYYYYFLGSTSIFKDIYDMVYIDKTSEIPVDMVFYAGDDANVDFMNCFSINSNSKNIKETTKFFLYLYSKEAQEIMYFDGTGRILPLTKKALHDSYNMFFNEYYMPDVMDKYAIFQ